MTSSARRRRQLGWLTSCTCLRVALLLLTVSTSRNAGLPIAYAFVQSATTVSTLRGSPKRMSFMNSRYGQLPFRVRMPKNTARRQRYPTRLATSTASNEKDSTTALPLRPHERGILLFYGLAGALLVSTTQQSRTTVLLAETALALVWSTMVLSISFLEAWVKFQAPFFKKYVAVDVGRYVFAALSATELALCGAFWAGRITQCWKSGVFFRNTAYYYGNHFVLPALASAALLSQVLSVSPKLYARAKAKIVQGFRDDHTDATRLLSASQAQELTKISRQVQDEHPLPSRQWHRVFAVLEFVKVICLQTFVVLAWKTLLMTLSRG